VLKRYNSARLLDVVDGIWVHSANERWIIILHARGWLVGYQLPFMVGHCERMRDIDLKVSVVSIIPDLQ
jgi:hypothetical protein